MTAELRLVDPDTGELITPGCRACHEHTVKIAGLEADLDALMKQLARTIRERDAARRAKDQERLTHKRRQEVEAIFHDWQQVCGKQSSKLGNDRFDTIAARLNNGYTAEHFHLAALGAAHNNPWRKQDQKTLMVEIETYARNSRWLEVFANAGAEWAARTGHATEIRVECVTEEAPATSLSGGMAQPEETG